MLHKSKYDFFYRNLKPPTGITGIQTAFIYFNNNVLLKKNTVKNE